jgi:hypothetical protein
MIAARKARETTIQTLTSTAGPVTSLQTLYCGKSQDEDADYRVEKDCSWH